VCISANAAEEERERFARWKWTSFSAVTGPAILSTLILISISYFYFYFSEDLIRFCFIVPTGPSSSPSESKVKNGRLGNILHIDDILGRGGHVILLTCCAPLYILYILQWVIVVILVIG